MSAPLVVNTRDGMCWTRRTVTSSGIALYAPEAVRTCPRFVMATLAELAERGITGSADVLPVPVGPEPSTGGYPPALPWARLLDAGNLYDFLGELADAAIRLLDGRAALAEVEDAIARWRVIGETQHGHDAAPGPDAEPHVAPCRWPSSPDCACGPPVEESADKLTRLLAPTQALREDTYRSPLRHEYRVGHDLPETGGAS